MIKDTTSAAITLIWRYVALTLLSVTIALAAWFGKNLESRVTQLEKLQIERAALLAQMNVKLDMLLNAHNIFVEPKK